MDGWMDGSVIHIIPSTFTVYVKPNVKSLKCCFDNFLLDNNTSV